MNTAPAPLKFDYEVDIPLEAPMQGHSMKVYQNGVLISENSDGSDPFYEPSDMAPMGPDEVGTWAIVFGLALAFAMTLGAALVVRWLLS